MQVNSQCCRWCCASRFYKRRRQSSFETLQLFIEVDGLTSFTVVTTLSTLCITFCLCVRQPFQFPIGSLETWIFFDGLKKVSWHGFPDVLIIAEGNQEPRRLKSGAMQPFIQIHHSSIQTEIAILLFNFYLSNNKRQKWIIHSPLLFFCCSSSPAPELAN